MQTMIIDSNISCLNKSLFLRSKGVTVVGRYYRVNTHPEWAITRDEALELSKAKIKIFMVFEEQGFAAKFSLTKKQGKDDGSSALAQANAIGQPQGSAIYFAVEGLPDGYTSADLPGIRDYFAGVKSSIGAKYQLGVYGDGVVCKTLLDEGICKYTWLAAASTSFEGTPEFYASGRWNLSQNTLDLEEGWDGLSIDINEAKADFGGFLVPIPAV
jgi:hypothetical protein